MSSPSAFAQRLETIVKGRSNKSVRSFALKANLSPPVIKKYLDGESTPNVERLIAICEVGGVSVEWLVTGYEVGDANVLNCLKGMQGQISQWQNDLELALTKQHYEKSARLSIQIETMNKAIELILSK